MYHTDYSRINHYKMRMESIDDISDKDFEGYSCTKSENSATQNNKHIEKNFFKFIKKLIKK